MWVGKLYTNEFGAWWEGLTEPEQDSVAHGVGLIEAKGPELSRPYADVIHGSQFPNMKELRIQHRGRPFRALFIFDTRRNAVLLLGGEKTGDDRWYAMHVPKADALYKSYLQEGD